MSIELSDYQKKILYAGIRINADKKEKEHKKINSKKREARRAIEKINDDLAIEHINTAHLEEDF